jgi:hypothetical protein
MLTEIEKNLIEIAAISASYPGTAATFKKIIQTHTAIALKQFPMAKVIMEVALDNIQTETPIEIKYLFKRGLHAVTENDPRAEDIPEIQKSLQQGKKCAESTKEAFNRLQERILANIGALPTKAADGLLALRERNDAAQQVLQHKPTQEIPILTPFAGISQGADAQTPNLPRRSCGIKAIDDHSLMGGLVPGTTMLICGFFHAGKTFLLYKFLEEEAYQGGTVLICSLEDNSELTTLRWYAYVLNENIPNISNLSGEQIANRIREKYKSQPHILKALERIHLWCPGTANTPTPQGLCEKIKSIEEELSVTFTRIGIDYIQNIDISKIPGDKRADKLAIAANTLINFTANEQKNSFIVSQGTAESETRNTKFLSAAEGLAEAKAMGRNAHYITTLKITPQEQARKLSSTDKRSCINIAIQKAKLGFPQGFYTIFNGRTWQFFLSESDRAAAFEKPTNSRVAGRCPATRPPNPLQGPSHFVPAANATARSYILTN